MTKRAKDGSRIGNRANKACEICGKKYRHGHPAEIVERVKAQEAGR